MRLWYMAHFSFAFKLQQQDGRRQKKAQNNLKGGDSKCVMEAGTTTQKQT